jgi:hypothetical protein
VNKGYSTKDDFVYNLIMRPNEQWTEDQAEQTLDQLLKEGKIEEMEEGEEEGGGGKKGGFSY